MRSSNFSNIIKKPVSKNYFYFFLDKKTTLKGGFFNLTYLVIA